MLQLWDSVDLIVLMYLYSISVMKCKLITNTIVLSEQHLVEISINMANNWSWNNPSNLLLHLRYPSMGASTSPWLHLLLLGCTYLASFTLTKYQYCISQASQFLWLRIIVIPSPHCMMMAAPLYHWWQKKLISPPHMVNTLELCFSFLFFQFYRHSHL